MDAVHAAVVIICMKLPVLRSVLLDFIGMKGMCAYRCVLLGFL